MRPGTRRSPQGAFTIVEVALAAAIMALGISSSIGVMQRGFEMVDSARSLTTAGQILVSQLEELRMYEWDVVNAYPKTDPTRIDIATLYTTNASVGSRFTLKRTVVALPAPATETLEITFAVSWLSTDQKRTLSRTMTTYYARYGIHDFYYNHP
jgi:hypothetical protein